MTNSSARSATSLKSRQPANKVTTVVCVSVSPRNNPHNDFCAPHLPTRAPQQATTSTLAVPTQTSPGQFAPSLPNIALSAFATIVFSLAIDQLSTYERSRGAMPFHRERHELKSVPNPHSRLSTHRHWPTPLSTFCRRSIHHPSATSCRRTKGPVVQSLPKKGPIVH